MSRRGVLLSVSLGLACLLLLAGAGSTYYHSSAASQESCVRCHEIRPAHDLLKASAHRNLKCADCHGGMLTADLGFHVNNFKRLVSHMRGETPERIELRQVDVRRMVERCQSCHRQQFADWQSGPHGSTYSKIFLDKKHNSRRKLMDDCLRCHGMHFRGAIRDLVTPVSLAGPWELTDKSLADQPVLPCLACHSMHREGPPAAQRKGRAAESSLALFDVRSRRHLALAGLEIPKMLEGSRAVKMSPDRRQALCYQCHAPLDSAQAGTGDDRTPLGVHEGLSCLACHQKHGQETRQSCANCHPRLSNCGLDVEKMDTTFASPNSRHNIHTVKCIDCHEKGIPPKRTAGRLRAD